MFLGLALIEVCSCPNDTGKQVIVHIHGIYFFLFIHAISLEILVLQNLWFFMPSIIVLIATAGVHLITVYFKG